MKSKEQLESFTQYCYEHPTERFWQALRNWSEAPFIYKGMPTRDGSITMVDTFYD